MSTNPSDSLETAAPVFAALGDRMRLQLVARLSEGGPMSITRLASGAPVTRQAVTKHLHVLLDAGIVRATRRGRERIWEMEMSQLLEARRHLELLSSRWDEALGRLKMLVESEQ